MKCINKARVNQVEWHLKQYNRGGEMKNGYAYWALEFAREAGIEHLIDADVVRAAQEYKRND